MTEEEKFLYWVSCERFTIGVVTRGKGSHAEICEAAPIARKFIGQPLRNLVQWMRILGGLKVAKIQDPL